jgi:hypothetical protein
VIEGGARGLDRIAREEAHARGIHVATVEALWDRFGRSAGYRRNEAMARLRPDRAFAYPLGESRGTRHTIAACEAAGMPVRVR